VVGGLVPRPQRVDQDDLKVRPEEREVVVSAVPQDDVDLLLGPRRDPRVVNPRVDDVADRDVRLVFLALLDGAAGRVEVADRDEALDRLALEVAIGHRVADRRRRQPVRLQEPRQPSRGLGLARAGAHGADRDDRHLGRDHRPPRAEKREIGARGDGDGGLVHDMGVLDIAVGEHHLVDPVLPADAGEIVLRQDRNAVRVAAAGERGRIGPAGDARDLGGGERHHLEGRIVAKRDIEVMEVAPGGTHDDDSPRFVGHLCRTSVRNRRQIG
jgi:hypothetical protein